MQKSDRPASGWILDMPQQFQGKRNIEILIRALARQMEEVETVLREINTLTDIDTACGKNLDYVGDIVCMSRKAAGELVNRRFPEPVISDEQYRKYLKYQVLRNTSDCTYADIMKAIDILWDVDRARYYEREDRPAIIFIGLPTAGIEEENPARGKPKILKPGGVGFVYTITYCVMVGHLCLERVCLQDLALRMQMLFSGCKLLNGFWILDGSVILNQRLRYDMKVVPVYGMRLPEQIKPFRSVGVDLGTAQRTGMQVQVHVVEKQEPGIVRMEQAVQVALQTGFRVQERETIRSSSVTVKKDLWYLDGEEALDNTRLLDADIMEEEL